jgi:hypothetical protein
LRGVALAVGQAAFQGMDLQQKRSIWLDCWDPWLLIVVDLWTVFARVQGWLLEQLLRKLDAEARLDGRYFVCNQEQLLETAHMLGQVRSQEAIISMLLLLLLLPPAGV